MRVQGLRVAKLQISRLGNLGFWVLRLESARIWGLGFESLNFYFYLFIYLLILFLKHKTIPGLDKPLILDTPKSSSVVETQQVLRIMWFDHTCTRGDEHC